MLVLPHTSGSTRAALNLGAVHTSDGYVNGVPVFTAQSGPSPAGVLLQLGDGVQGDTVNTPQTWYPYIYGDQDDGDYHLRIQGGTGYTTVVFPTGSNPFYGTSFDAGCAKLTTIVNQPTLYHVGTSGVYFICAGSSLNQASVDAVLAAAAAENSGAGGTVDLSGANASAPSSTGVIDATTARSHNWYISYHT